MINRTKAKDLIAKDDTQPGTLDYILSNTVPEWLLWEPETIWTFIRSYTGRNPSFLTRTKINAMKFLRNSEAPWEEWEDFTRAVNGITGVLLDFDVLTKPTLDDVFVGVSIMKRLRPDMDFSDEVKRYIAAICLDEGIMFVPPPLEFVQPILDVVEYRCTLCGNVDIYDNGMCDTCHAPEAALIKVPRYFDWTAVKEKWDLIKTNPLGTIQLDENLIDIHIQKILHATLRAREAMDTCREEVAYVSN